MPTHHHPGIVLLVNALGGAAAGVVIALVMGFGSGLLVPVALSGAAILALAELASWMGRSRWSRGLLFGAVGGVLVAGANYLIASPDAALLTLVLPYLIAGIVSGLIMKSFSGEEEAQPAV